MKPIISIVGRPNVGKSTLFNRIIGYRKAIIEDSPGVTRDRNYGEFEYNGQAYVLVDTGGFEPFTDDNILQLVKEHIHISMDESSAIIFVLDGRDGILPQDMDIAKALRKYNKPVIYVINKIDSAEREIGAAEFYELGVEKTYTISALHGKGIGELLDEVCEATSASSSESGYPLAGRRSSEKEQKDEARKTRDDRMPGPRSTLDQPVGQAFQTPRSTLHAPRSEAPEALRIAIVGRPNTGKSSITNRILGSERMIVSDIPGTTRDSIDSKILFRNKEIVLIDTAGLRRKSRISMKVEEYSASSAIQSIERADVVNLTIDAEEGVSHQDAGIVHTIVTRGKGLCIVVNKWDLVKGKTEEKTYKKMVRERAPHAAFSPVLFTSAITGQNIEKILETDLKIHDQLEKRISTPRLNKAFEEFFQKASPPHVRGKQIKIFYISQAKTSPPTFVLFSNYPKSIPEHYRRYLENSLREKFGFTGAPIQLVFKKK